MQFGLRHAARFGTWRSPGHAPRSGGEVRQGMQHGLGHGCMQLSLGCAVWLEARSSVWGMEIKKKACSFVWGMAVAGACTSVWGCRSSEHAARFGACLQLGLGWGVQLGVVLLFESVSGGGGWWWWGGGGVGWRKGTFQGHRKGETKTDL